MGGIRDKVKRLALFSPYCFFAHDNRDTSRQNITEFFSLMGVVGMLIFIPIVSVLYALFREVVYLKLKQREITPEEVEKI